MEGAGKDAAAGWIDESQFGCYVREAGAGAVQWALYDRWSDGEVCLDVVTIPADEVAWRLEALAAGKIDGFGQDALTADKDLCYGTDDVADGRFDDLEEMRRAVAEVTSWTPQETWLARRREA